MRMYMYMCVHEHVYAQCVCVWCVCVLLVSAGRGGVPFVVFKGGWTDVGRILLVCTIVHAGEFDRLT